MTNKLVKQTTATPAWDAGAVSVTTRGGDLQATFTLVGGSEGVAVGLAPDGAALSLNSISHGVMAFEGQLIEVIEDGMVVATSTVTFSADVAVQLRRVGATLFYTVGSWTYTSLAPSTGTVRLMALLFDTGDAVDVPVLTFYEEPVAGGKQINEVLQFTDNLLYDAFVYGWLSDGVTLTNTLDGGIELIGSLADWVVFVNEYQPQATYEAMLTNLLQLRDSASATSQELLQYATNLITGAVGRYSGFDFEGFARVDMGTYGWKRDGLYRIEDGDDNGDPISALVEFGSEAFANQMKTRIVALFFGLSTDGQVFVRLVDDNKREVLYRAKRQQAVYRSNPYQGNQSKRWSLRLEIVDATEVQLDSVEWVVGSTNRRTTT